MAYEEGILKRELRAIFSRATAGRKAIPIFWGPLRGMRLPREVACRNFSMLINMHEAHVISEIVSLPHSIQYAYDIGAHCGLLSLALSKRVKPGGKVFAFEPCPENYRHIEELIVVNHFSSAVVAFELALAEWDGEQILHIGETAFMNQLENLVDGFPNREMTRIPVQAAKLDTLVTQGRIPPPDFIKLDVEGGEVPALKGARRTLEAYHPEILIEIHGPHNGEVVWDLLGPFRYSWYHVVSRGKHRIFTKEELFPLFSKEAWTQHFHLRPTEGPH